MNCCSCCEISDGVTEEHHFQMALELLRAPWNVESVRVALNIVVSGVEDEESWNVYSKDVILKKFTHLERLQLLPPLGDTFDLRQARHVLITVYFDVCHSFFLC